MPSSTTEPPLGRVPGARAALVWGVLAIVLVTVSSIGIFLVAPEDVDQGVIQRIFYFHVAIAITSLIAFAVACVAASTPELRRYHASMVTTSKALGSEPVRTSQGEAST